MSLAVSVTAAAAAAACGWPAASIAEMFSVASGWPAASSRHAQARAARALSAGRRAAALSALVTGALVLLVMLRLRQELLAAACGWLVVCGLPLAVIDMRVRRLPDPLTAACFAGIAALLIADAAAGGRWQDLGRAAAGAAAAALLFALAAVARPGSSGLGDAKLSLSTGALAAWLGWGALLTSAFAAFGLAACYGLGMLAAGRVSLRTGSVPLGPFLVAGCLAVVLLAGL